MHFILFDQFGDTMESFSTVFKVKDNSHASLLAKDRVSRASKFMTPFVLRRRKDQVRTHFWCEVEPHSNGSNVRWLEIFLERLNMFSGVE